MTSLQPCVLSTDLDGVLHARDAHFAIEDVNTSSPQELHAAGLFENRALLAAELAPYPEARIVVHSSWRASSDKARLVELLGALGDRVWAVAPAEVEGREAALLKFARSRALEHDQLVILDDQPELFSKLRARVIVCPHNAGISAPTALLELRLALARSHTTS